jgi:hypothetical protein
MHGFVHWSLQHFVAYVRSNLMEQMPLLGHLVWLLQQVADTEKMGCQLAASCSLDGRAHQDFCLVSKFVSKQWTFVAGMLWSILVIDFVCR